MAWLFWDQQVGPLQHEMGEHCLLRNPADTAEGEKAHRHEEPQTDSFKPAASL
jgi:hypothetical protein